MNNKVNGVEDPSVNHMEMDKSGPPASNEDSPIDYSILLMPFRRRSTTDLQEAWPVLESSLEEYGISCELDMDQFFITFTTTRAKDPYAILNSRYLIRLLAAEVPPRQDKYVSRKKLLMTLPIQELEKLTGCSIYLRPNNDMVAAMGPIKGLKLVRSIVEDCIVHNMPPAHRVKRLANYVQAIKGVEALRL
ncbi:KRR1 small subunit processome component homolog isoform X3 [Prunus dulcis]|uniref:KRR1 small subunit processome component homolog isoform X3 n=1 Tax=Prunus dulcis TaxID=3755 RepID=UPI001482C21D|nr:KRR1 small subunit processome component homolog isoform X3 [Prunus dulcis]